MRAHELNATTDRIHALAVSSVRTLSTCRAAAERDNVEVALGVFVEISTNIEYLVIL